MHVNVPILRASGKRLNCTVETFVISKPRLDVRFAGRARTALRYLTETTETDTEILSRESVVGLLTFGFELLSAGLNEAVFRTNLDLIEKLLVKLAGEEKLEGYEVELLAKRTEYDEWLVYLAGRAPSFAKALK